jgi:hypothetical protein
VRDWFQRYLGRQPNAAELSVFVGRLNNGEPRANVLQTIFQSDAYWNRLPEPRLNNYINQVFFDIVGHYPNGDQAAFFLSLAQTQNIRVLLPQALLVTNANPEYYQYTLNGWFFQFLRRRVNTPPDLTRNELTGPFQAQGFVNFLAAGGSQDDVMVAILASQEYYGLAAQKAFWTGARWLG